MLLARPARTVVRPAEMVAAVDLGSNSFHLIVARLDHGQLHVLDRLQEMVRLASGLDDQGQLDKPTMKRALDCLARFGERLRGIPKRNVRAVATATLRRARNGAAFLARAGRALGRPIEVISGQEEARLIYEGVAQDLPAHAEQRLLIDIGGGSTEVILGQGMRAQLTESLHIGCVSLSAAHFPDGRITHKRLARAETAARLEFKPVEAQFRARGWEVAYGSSGTIRTVEAVLKGLGLEDEGVGARSLARLREQLLAFGHIARLDLPGLSPERAPVFPGGVAILSAAFRALGINRMQAVGGALREGLLYDLLGRIRHKDVRAQTIAALSARYHVDTAQAERVAATAQRLFDQAAEEWGLGEDERQALTWAARLHELGLAIAHTKYHRHGAYLLEHSDLPGFSFPEQRLIALLVRAHRRRFPLEVFEPLPKKEARIARRLALLLRLSVLLHRGRTGSVPPRVTLAARKRRVSLRFPRGWLNRNPLTATDLAQEIAYLKPAGQKLEFE
jgi:exopolyphosphatase/guanosine-5'-triphosphate,3'-diphosphate pyrophosphatase